MNVHVCSGMIREGGVTLVLCSLSIIRAVLFSEWLKVEESQFSRRKTRRLVSQSVHEVVFLNESPILKLTFEKVNAALIWTKIIFNSNLQHKKSYLKPPTRLKGHYFDFDFSI